MKTTVVRLVALPVILGGVGVTAAAVYYSEPSPYSAEMSPTQAQNRNAESGDGGGTSIDGRRPHLTVHDGNRLLLAGSLAGLHSARPIPVPPLAVDAPALRNASSAETTAPASAAATGSAEVAVPPRQISTNPSAHSPAPVTGGPQPAPPPRTAPDPEPVRQPTAAAPPSAAPPVAAPHITDRDDDPSSGWRPDPGRAAGDVTGTRPGVESRDDTTGPPPHARDTGRPDHADTTGPPPHANANANANANRGSDTSTPR